MYKLHKEKFMYFVFLCIYREYLRFSFAISKETCIFAKSKPLSYSIPIEQLRYSSRFSWAFFMPF